MTGLHDLINEYLLQANECSLPPLGILTNSYHPAQIDNVNKLIYPPFNQVTFEQTSLPVSQGLIWFVAYKNDWSDEVATSEVEGFGNTWMERIINGESLCFEEVGCIKQNEEGELSFDAQHNIQNLPVLAAEKVLHKDAGHNVLVGDRETTSQVMTDYYSAQPVLSSGKWKLWAAILLTVGLTVIIFSLYNKGFAPDSIGNNHHLKVDDEPKTYKKIEQGK